VSDPNHIRESDQRRLRELAARHPKLFRGLVVPWFTPEGYLKMRAAASDRDNLFDTFEEFEQAAGERFHKAVADGHPAEKVVVDANALIAWCAEEGRPLDGMARQLFAAMTVVKRDAGAGHA